MECLYTTESMFFEKQSLNSNLFIVNMHIRNQRVSKCWESIDFGCSWVSSTSNLVFSGIERQSITVTVSIKGKMVNVLWEVCSPFQMLTFT